MTKTQQRLLDLLNKHGKISATKTTYHDKITGEELANREPKGVRRYEAALALVELGYASIEMQWNERWSAPRSRTEKTHSVILIPA